MASPSSDVLQSKFRAAMLGGLIGDCLGVRFETAERPVAVSFNRVAEFFESFHPTKETVPRQSGSMYYTDDSAMMRVLADSLIRNKQVDMSDLAKEFTEEYYTNKSRGYGMHVVHVFEALRKNPPDVLLPAKSQFNGTGSYGNGAAMRVTPVALLYHQDTEKMIEASRQSSLVTHAHANGYNGANLLCLAIQAAMKANLQTPIEPIAFVKALEDSIEPLEKSNAAYGPHLKKMRNLLSKPEPPSIKEVVAELGNNVTALYSVPTAIYAFLRGQQPIPNITTPNQYERTIQYAISLGGDTDTIGCMAGAVCGAQVGYEAIPKYLIEPCEAHDKIKDLADALRKVFQENNVQEG